MLDVYEHVQRFYIMKAERKRRQLGHPSSKIQALYDTGSQEPSGWTPSSAIVACLAALAAAPPGQHNRSPSLLDEANVRREKHGPRWSNPRRRRPLPPPN